MLNDYKLFLHRSRRKKIKVWADLKTGKIKGLKDTLEMHSKLFNLFCFPARLSLEAAELMVTACFREVLVYHHHSCSLQTSLLGAAMAACVQHATRSVVIIIMLSSDSYFL